MRRRPGRLVTAALTISAGMSVTSPAQPALVRFEDRRGDAEGRMDIEWVSVDNGRPLTIIIKHRDLTRSTAEAGAFIDVVPGAGPEYLVNGGVYDSDYQLSRANGWHAGDRPLNCPVIMTRTSDETPSPSRSRVAAWTTGPAQRPASVSQRSREFPVSGPTGRRGTAAGLHGSGGRLSRGVPSAARPSA
jgi:hypothetical protein